jgi:FG-GAP repeat/FG-GAP-like repeat
MTRLFGRAFSACVLVAALLGPVNGPAAFATGASHPPATSDFDGDGRADVAAATITGGIRVAYTSARPDGAHVAWLTSHLPPHQGQMDFGEAMAVGDVNGDGYCDLIVSAPLYGPKPVGGKPRAVRGAVVVYFGARSGLGPRPEVILGPKGEQPNAYFGYDLAVGDLNGDGYADVAVSHRNTEVSTPDVRLYLGSAEGPPTVPSQVLADNVALGLAIGDVNGDGRLDLISASEPLVGETGIGHLTVWPGTAQSMGTPYRIDLADLGLRYAADLVLDAGDLDGDGYADLVVGDEVDQTRAGTYTSTLLVVRGSAAGLTAAGYQDINGDRLTGQTNMAFASAVSVDPAHDGVPGRVYVGAQYERVRGVGKAGAVHVFHWDGTGLSTSRVQRITQASPGVPGRPIRVGSFGVEVWAARTTHQRYAQLFVGAVGPRHHGRSAGAYYQFRGDSAGVRTRTAVRVSGHHIPGLLGITIRRAA